MTSRILFGKNIFQYDRSFKLLSKISSSSYHSLGPMTAHHNSLPRQPVPHLGSTLEKYLKAVRPLITEDEFKRTKKLVEDFASPGGIGHKLHSVLQERYKTLDNWMGDWWTEMDFLELRLPIVGFSNPCGFWAVEKFQNMDDYLRYSARLTVALLDYKKHVDNHLVEPDKLRKEPLDMNQYFRIFSTCRIPQKNCDRQMLYGLEENPPKHIVVVRNNQFYQLEVYDSQGNPLPESLLFQNLKQIVSDAEAHKDEPPLGVLTTEKRETWAEAYEHLKSDSLNKKNLEIIQRAMFLLCLDKHPKTMNISKDVEHMHNVMHGGGSKYNGCNRWYDKCLQFIVSEDGVIGHNMEHSPAEGYSLVKLVQHVSNYVKNTSVEWFDVQNTTAPTKLNFNFSKEILKSIDVAKENINKLSEDIDIDYLIFKNYGKDYIKSNNFSPDSFIQMAFQLAYYRLHGLRGVLYEVATLHRFLHGRMEIVHSTSAEAIEFCKTMLDYNANLREKAVALRIAVAAHKNLVHEAHRGEGLDAHLLGLRRAAKVIGIEEPKLFKDYGFRMCYYYRLVTSQLPMDNIELIGSFGPLYIDGYGLPYGVYPDKINFFAFSLFHRPETSSSNLIQAINCSLEEMQEVVDKSGKLDLKYDLNVAY
ncbi:carnitine O-acetyltransferase-like [Centruroides vittatus]|uniref:carnitine O-acetyltransferase-like n=1 Tax=Centruroides vittatus TaxID=120091 RepID=UPI00350EDB49